MERSVHHCPCPDCQVGSGPIADRHRRLNLISVGSTSSSDDGSRRPRPSGSGTVGTMTSPPSPGCTPRPFVAVGTSWPPTWRIAQPTASASQVEVDDLF